MNGNWGMNPTVGTNLSGTLWAARFFAEKVPSGTNGATTVSISSAFRSYNFNGLVTFQNLNQELGDPASSNITTIDGGKITTDSIEANKLKASALDTITAHVQDNITIGGATSIDTSGTAGTTGQRMVLTDNLITIYDSSSDSASTGIRVKLGDLGLMAFSLQSPIHAWYDNGDGTFSIVWNDVTVVQQRDDYWNHIHHWWIYLY